MLSSATPDAETLLRAIAAAAPGLWFPQPHADSHGIPREALTEPLWLLRQTGLVEVGDWVKGLGQGLRLSDRGTQAVTSPDPLAIPSPVPLPPPRREPDAPLALEQGDAVRTAVLDPPPAVVAPSLLYANLAWFAVGCLVAWRHGVGLEFLKGDGHPGAMATLMDTGATTAGAVWRGDWWRLATCCFVHIGLFHLLCNMLMLGLMGPFAEGLWGKGRFALIYGVAGVCGSAAAMALHPVAPTGAVVVMAGASGALWGMLAGVVVWVVRARQHLPPELLREWARKLMFLVVMNVAISFAPGVSAEAHFGGGAAGAVVAWSVSGGHRRPRLWAVGGVGVSLLASGLLLAGTIRWSDGWQAVKEREKVRRLIADMRLDERAAIRAAVGDDWGKLSPVNVNAVHARFLYVNPARVAAVSVGPPTLRGTAERLRLAAAEAVPQVPPENELGDRYRDYFTAVAAYATALRDELDRPGRKETPEVDVAWKAYGEAQARLGRWE